jgi:hypothetical protein
VAERNNRTVSVKIQANTPEEIMALVRAINGELPGVKMTSGIKPSDHRDAQGRFDYGFYCFLLVSFELTASGNARPTQRNAVIAFQEGLT